MVRSFEEFALVDVHVGDIDPTYWAINRATKEYGSDWAKRFCVAMLTYYHTGTAAVAADHEGKVFWEFLMDMYPTCPRAAERRHFRGEAGTGALLHMANKFPEPQDFFKPIPRNYHSLMKYCESELKQFGPYFQLKIADYMDRCLGMFIAQESMHRLGWALPTLPAKAVKMLYPVHSIPDGFAIICERVAKLKMLAPPTFDRLIGPAEVETILCDWKRAKTGSSWMGADVADKRHAFKGYGGKAAQMADWMPISIDSKMFKLEL